jgi:hypothetical protein
MDPVEPAAQSVQESLRDARNTILVNERVTLEIPGYGGLFAHYRLLDFRESRKVGEGVQGAGCRDEIDRELYLAADSLIAACVGTEARLKGPDGNLVTHDLGVKLGKPLAEYLGLGEFENDRQAVLLIFRRNTDLVEQFAVLQTRDAYVNQEADETLVGESGAAGSPS